MTSRTLLGRGVGSRISPATQDSVRWASVLGEVPQDFVHEKRIAIGLLVDGVGDPQSRVVQPLSHEEIP